MNTQPLNDNQILNKIKLIKEFADENDWFKSEFVESLEEQFKTRGTLSKKQESSIDNIIDKCKIMKWLKMKNHEEHKDLRMVFNLDGRN